MHTIWMFAIAFLMLPTSVAASEAEALIGNWKLVSFQTVIDSEPPRDLYGPSPKGFLSMSREGRLIVLITGDDRKAGPGDAERAALHKSMIAYSGKYRVAGKEFITTVDASWNEAWNGTEQKRYYKLEGNRVTIDSAPQPSTLYPGKTSVSRLVWEREK